MGPAGSFHVPASLLHPYRASSSARVSRLTCSRKDSRVPSKSDLEMTSTEHEPTGEGYERIDQYDPARIEQISGHYAQILQAIGEDPQREGLLKTPERVAKALQYLTHGYDLDPAAILRSAMFTEAYSQMVVVKDIEVYLKSPV